MQRRTMMAMALVPWLAAPLRAAEVGGVKLAEQASVDGKTLVLNGAGIRTKLVFKVYVASLYLTAKANTLAGVMASNPRRVQLNLLRDLSADDLAGALADGIDETSTAEQAAAVKAQTEQMVKIMKSVGSAKTGDVVTIDFAGGETRIGFNGQGKGAIGGEPFNAALMRIWLADKPVQPDLRKALLGG
ncbi:MAG: chalcone isomerase family protein [Burkholderiales bacterium]|nr:chalcone isomerase family protein [Burkholderiales bacterium]